jgi:hypothetical protein
VLSQVPLMHCAPERTVPGQIAFGDVGRGVGVSVDVGVGVGVGVEG